MPLPLTRFYLHHQLLPSHTPFHFISASSNPTQCSWPWSSVISVWYLSLSLQTREQSEWGEINQGKRHVFKGTEEYQWNHCSPSFQNGKLDPTLRWHNLTLNVQKTSQEFTPSYSSVFLPTCLSYYVYYSSTHAATLWSSCQHLKTPPALSSTPKHPCQNGDCDLPSSCCFSLKNVST